MFPSRNPVGMELWVSSEILGKGTPSRVEYEERSEHKVSGTMEAILRESRVTYRLSPSLLAGSGLVSELASSGAPLDA